MCAPINGADNDNDADAEVDGDASVVASVFVLLNEL